ncbi:hypothetical protein GYMLUDRAFT_250234 [Collybiopsis luxurians FD-317 M1]|uniref:Uncharacterized protein n=1 Tax=Collybiopsis luxurians FD-317 M1 TaxID=944289 RepID=A0A0D0AT80_9AGAR|nr:hypothetical protein GYMLUDRAFT_250234 [Collybiopsis luxurians FD-317 M1]
MEPAVCWFKGILKLPAAMALGTSSNSNHTVLLLASDSSAVQVILQQTYMIGRASFQEIFNTTAALINDFTSDALDDIKSFLYQNGNLALVSDIVLTEEELISQARVERLEINLLLGFVFGTENKHLQEALDQESKALDALMQWHDDASSLLCLFIRLLCKIVNDLVITEGLYYDVVIRGYMRIAQIIKVQDALALVEESLDSLARAVISSPEQYHGEGDTNSKALSLNNVYDVSAKDSPESDDSGVAALRSELKEAVDHFEAVLQRRKAIQSMIKELIDTTTHTLMTRNTEAGPIAGSTPKYHTGFHGTLALPELTLAEESESKFKTQSSDIIVDQESSCNLTRLLQFSPQSIQMLSPLLLLATLATFSQTETGLSAQTESAGSGSTLPPSTYSLTSTTGGLHPSSPPMNSSSWSLSSFNSLKTTGNTDSPAPEAQVPMRQILECFPSCFQSHSPE